MHFFAKKSHFGQKHTAFVAIFVKKSGRESRLVIFGEKNRDTNLTLYHPFFGVLKIVFLPL